MNIWKCSNRHKTSHTGAKSPKIYKSRINPLPPPPAPTFIFTVSNSIPKCNGALRGRPWGSLKWRGFFDLCRIEQVFLTRGGWGGMNIFHRRPLLPTPLSSICSILVEIVASPLSDFFCRCLPPSYTVYTLRLLLDLAEWKWTRTGRGGNGAQCVVSFIHAFYSFYFAVCSERGDQVKDRARKFSIARCYPKILFIISSLWMLLLSVKLYKGPLEGESFLGGGGKKLNGYLIHPWLRCNEVMIPFLRRVKSFINCKKYKSTWKIVGK